MPSQIRSRDLASSCLDVTKLKNKQINNCQLQFCKQLSLCYACASSPWLPLWLITNAKIPTWHLCAAHSHVLLSSSINVSLAVYSQLFICTLLLFKLTHDSACVQLKKKTPTKQTNKHIAWDFCPESTLLPYSVLATTLIIFSIIVILPLFTPSYQSKHL